MAYCLTVFCSDEQLVNGPDQNHDDGSSYNARKFIGDVSLVLGIAMRKKPYKESDAERLGDTEILDSEDIGNEPVPEDGEGESVEHDADDEDDDSKQDDHP